MTRRSGDTSRVTQSDIDARLHTVRFSAQLSAIASATGRYVTLLVSRNACIAASLSLRANLAAGLGNGLRGRPRHAERPQQFSRWCSLRGNYPMIKLMRLDRVQIGRCRDR